MSEFHVGDRVQSTAEDDLLPEFHDVIGTVTEVTAWGIYVNLDPGQRVNGRYNFNPDHLRPHDPTTTSRSTWS